jgi:hypothetical protein
LPAEVLAPSAAPSTRHSSAEVDPVRLLSRVARAFAAAQERDGEVRLRLSPPELGSLRLDVRVQDGALVAHLQTETDAARTAIIDNLPTLRDRLASAKQPHHTSLANAGHHLIAQCAELFGHDPCGANLLKSQFRVHMQIAPNRDQIPGQLLSFRKKRRGHRFSFAARRRRTAFRAIALMAVLYAQ